MVKCYYYLFYRFYKLSEAAPSRWWSEWKAGAALTVMIFLILAVIEGYYSIITYKDIIPEKNGKLIVGAIAGSIGLMNYFIFAHREQWKSIISCFDKLPAKKQRTGKMLFWLFVIGVLGNLVFMFYLMSQIDWQSLRQH